MVIEVILVNLRKSEGQIRSVTSVIDGFTESKDIANAFASKYSVLYNSVISPDTELQFMSHSIEQGSHTQCFCVCFKTYSKGTSSRHREQ